MVLPTAQSIFTVLVTTTEGLSFRQVSFLTFQAVVQVFIICLSGFWAANSNLLNNDGVRAISRLNVDLFTPALIFSKLASSLSLKKLVELILIPILYALTTLVSYFSSILVSNWLELTEPESNFVIAMSVFGNSNSLPVSLTLALAYSLPHLEWDDIPNDNPDKIASRGLIYLLIFQQLGQMLRWSWGCNKLLTRQPDHVIFYQSQIDEEGNFGNNNNNNNNININININNDYNYSYHDHDDHDDNSHDDNHDGEETDDYDHYNHTDFEFEDNSESGLLRGTIPEEIKIVEESTIKKTFKKFMSYMNPPLWSMVFALIIASVPFLKAQFYDNDGFVQNTLSSAIQQLGEVSIPLILVVLGADLAPGSDVPPACPHYKRMILGSLLGRMVLPSIILLPIIILSVKFLALSIMQDPIFLITSFLLITAPPALQLSQICQLNEIYQKEMAGVLFYGYAILTLPVTIIVVVTSIQAMKWSQA